MLKSFKSVAAFTAGAVVVLAMQHMTFVDVATAQGGVGDEPLVAVDQSGAIPIYANFARVTGTPDEAIIDLGILTELGEPQQPVRIHHQVVCTYPTLKRLTTALNQTIERYEANFGPIELDVNQRLKR